MENELKQTTYQLGKIFISFDGSNYHAHIKERMSAEGFLNWQNSHVEQISFAKLYCYTQHVTKFGVNGQTMPDMQELVIDEQENIES